MGYIEEEQGKAEYECQMEEDAQQKYAQEKHAEDCFRAELIGRIPTDRLELICAAEKDGRCVVFPCKVGDKMFSHRWNIKSEKYEVRTGNVKNVRHDALDNSAMISDGEMYGMFGKTVFLTPESAAAALKEREQDG